MECFNLHSLILEELSEVLAITYGATLTTNDNTDTSITATDGEISLLENAEPAVQKLLAQCPSTQRHSAVNTRQLSGILALIKLVEKSQAGSKLRQALLARVLIYIELLPHYTHTFTADSLTDDGGSGPSAEHVFVRSLMGRLLACAANAQDDAEAARILDGLWAYVRVLAAKASAGAQGAEALGGALAALEQTRFRFGASDVMQAELLLQQVGAPALAVVRAVLESRLALRLVSGGALAASAVGGLRPRDLWEVISGQQQPQEDDFAALPPTGTAETPAYARILALSLAAYDAARAQAVSDTMRRSLYVAALGCMLLRQLDARLLDAVLAHVRGPQAQRLAALTQACFRVLAALAARFASARAQVAAAAMAFLTAPPQCMVDAAPTTGRAAPEELTMVQPAADALAAALALAGPRAGGSAMVSAAHTLFGALATAAGDQARGVCVARNVALALARIAADDAELAALAVGMLCAPRFVAAPALLPLALQCAAAVAPAAGRTVFADVVAAALKHVDFADGADGARTAAAAAALMDLATGVGGRRALAEPFLGMALRAFVDASVGVPAPARFRRRALTPLAVFLPVLVALVDGGSGECDADLDSDADTPDAPPDTVDLWRAFWFHVVARGYLADAAHVAAYGTAFAALAAKAPALVHASSVNYLETELAFSSVLQRDASASDASVVRLRSALTALLPATLHPAVRSLGFAQAAFLLSVHAVETLRAQSAGNCARMLRYFANAAVASSALLLPAVEAVADLVVAAYVRETTTRRWAIDSAPPPADAAAGRVKAQVRELMVAACHHLELVSRWAQRFADRILLAFPQALLDTSVIGTLLELVQLVWKSCRAAQDDQFVPVYWFTSRTLGITLQLPDSIAYRKTLFARVSECARRWLELAGRAAPMELETLLLAYLAAPSDDDLNCEPHVGHALALEVGNAIRYGLSPAEDAADVLTPNASPFTYRLGLRSYLRGHTRRGEDLAEIKRELAAVYAQAVVGRADTVGLPQPDMRSITSRLHQATHSVVAAASVDRELVRLLVWVPLTLFDESMMRAAMHMWTTLIVERPAVEVLLMVELTVAWTWLIQQHRGLFAQRFEPKNPFAARMSYTPSDKSARARAHASISCALTPHSLLIEFITQRFDSVKHLPDTNFNVINATLRILQVTFDNAPRITTNALARAPLFMLVQLGFKLLNLGFEASPILECTLRRGLYRLAFRWFALPPRWSFSGSKVSLAREIRILIDTCNTVSADFPLAALPTTPTGTGTAAATATAGPGLAVDPAVSASVTSLADPDDAAQAVAAPILGVSREQLRQRALSNRSLLLLLLENEISRMVTWANPTSQPLDYFPDTSRFTRTAEMSESGWQNVVLDAWVADPALAVQLLHRFSHPIIRRELTGLICRFPGELVDEPDALPLLVDQLQYSSSSAASTASAATGLGGTGTGGISAPAAASSLFGNLGSALTFREQKFLLYWTPVPPITSTVYLASSNFARNPLALQYAMRALESFPVEVTFFYIPQLVQALRHDTLGYVERAILSSAQISQHFAHQIIWNMNANMFKDEESLQPDSLKPVLDRIVQRIVNSLSGEDRVYYEKEFAFFGEVTGISGKLKPFIKKSKPEKKRKIDEEMRKIKVEPGVYLPSNPDGTVVDIDYDSGRPLQSHAKAPFMATFIISRPRDAANDEVQALLEEEERTVTPSTDIPDDNDVDAAEAIQLLPVIGGSPSLGAQISIEIARPEDDNQADNDAESAATAAAATAVSEPIDTGYLSSKLAMTRIEARRTISSAISDAPDLIGIMSQQQQQHSGTGSGRPSREYSANRASRQISSVLPTSSSLTESTNHYRGSTAEQLSAMTTEIVQTEDTARETEPKIENKGQVISRLSAIFKVGDDCRQDVLALQLIAVFKNIFTSCGLDLYLYPYRVVATAPGCGVIDVIPNSISRDQMGREKVNSLSDYFATRYHGVDSIQYQQARSNFVQSLAAYSVLSYLLQFKDRHNGNIMLDDQGHIVHIDFGFILDIAPGGINFESAPFKLTTEYIQVMGGSADAQPYRLFCELCIKAYLASRPYADRIIQIVSLMLDSGLPCFKGESTLVKLKGRFQLEKNEREAAVFMAERISDSYENKRTVLYDQFQKATNGIPH